MKNNIPRYAALLSVFALAGCTDYGAGGAAAHSATVHHMRNLKMYELSGSSRPWTLTADTAEMKDGDDSADLTEPFAIYAQGNSTSTIKSRTGKFNLEERTAVFNKNVVSYADEGRMKLETERLHYSPKLDKVWSDDKLKTTETKADSTTTITAMSGSYNLKDNIGVFIGNVIARELKDNVTLETEKLNYAQKTEMLWSDIPVKMTEIRDNAPMVVTADRGDYNIQYSTAVFTGHVLAIQQKDNVTLETEKLYYSQKAAQIWSEDNVKMKGVKENSLSTITARRGSYDLNDRSALFTGNVVANSQKDKTALETEKLNYSSKRALIYTDEAVKLTSDGMIVNGKGFESNPDLSEISISNQETELTKKK